MRFRKPHFFFNSYLTKRQKYSIIIPKYERTEKMKLELEDIKRITFGVNSIEENLGSFAFCRFTKEQSEAYRKCKHNIDFFNKTFATAGVRFSFYTDASKMSFDYKFAPASSRMYGWFDVYEDGVMTSHIGGEGKLFTSGHAEINFSKGEKRVEIYFPWSKVTFLSNIEIECDNISPCVRSRSMICFGDSITHGYDAVYPSLSYTSLLAKELDADMLNKGIGGDIFFPELATLPDKVTPDIITVAYGTNDWSICTREQFNENCKAFFENLTSTYPNSKIFAVTPLWRADFEKETKFGVSHDCLFDIMKNLLENLKNVTVINGYSLTPHVKEFYSDEYLHPNDLGFSIYARELAKQIKKYL